MREIRTAEEAESIRQVIEDLAEGRFAIDDAGRVDWDAFLLRVEEHANVDLGSDMGSPAIRRIQKTVCAFLRDVGV